MASYGREQDFVLRPLSKGMFTDLPANGIPSGGFHDLKNMHVKEGYIETRGGYHPYFNGSIDLVSEDLIAYDYGNLREKIQDVIYHWKTTAQSETLVTTSEFLYEVINQDQINHILFTSGELTTDSGSTVSNRILTVDVLTGTEINIRANDYMREFGSTQVVGRVINISSGTYTIELDPSYTWVDETSIEILHTFSVEPGFKVDYTVLGGYGTDEAGNELILTDQADRGVYHYSDGLLTIYDIDSSALETGLPEDQVLASAKATAFFDDRLWLGNITETTGANYPQRIWWSDALNFDRFDPTGYLDLPYSQGELLAIKPLGPLLVLYFSDTLYIGRATQIIGRPYEFQQLSTNDIGLVSQAALATYDDGHFFVGQDDIYYLSGSNALQRIGSPIKSETVEKTSGFKLLDYIQVSSDPETESVAFLFPDESSEVTDAVGLSKRIWRFYYKPQAWAYQEVPIINGQPQAYFSSLSSARTVTRSNTYQDWYDIDGTAGDPSEQTTEYTVPWDGDASLGAVYDEDGSAPGTPPTDQIEWTKYESYNDLNSFSVSVPRLFMGVYYVDASSYYVQNIMYESKDADQDTIGGTTYDIDYVLISPDLDFGYPDTAKFTRQFSIRTMEHADEFFQPTVWVSDAKTRRNPLTGSQDIWWQRAPTIKFFTNYNEGKTGFLMRGSIFKFKVQFTRSTERYRISEIVVRSKIEGQQVDL